MNVVGFVARLFAAFIALAVVMVIYVVAARPFQLTWGASQVEIERSMPGDSILSDPDFAATRAITIQAPPEDIFPWLLQMGYGRAGFYGYDLLENLGSPRGISSEEVIVPELQHFQVGDSVPISAIAELKFHSIEPDQYVIWTSQTADSSFTWALYPTSDGSTRLVSRVRLAYHWSQPAAVPLQLFTEFADHLAVRKILQGIKGRVEGNLEPLALNTVELLTHIAAFLLCVAVLIMLLWRKLTWARWGVVLGTGLVWLLVWYSPLPFWVSLGFVAATLFVVKTVFFARASLNMV